MILGNAEHHKEASARPIRFAELPKAAAESVHPGCRHIDRAEPTMRREVWSPELGCPKAGQRLALVAAGEECEFFRLAFAELSGAAFPDPSERLSQFCRGALLHDAGSALATDHAAVDRMVAVAFDVTDAAVLEMNFDPAAAGAHIAGRALDLVGQPGRSLYPLSRRKIIAHTLAKVHAVSLRSIDSAMLIVLPLFAMKRR